MYEFTLNLRATLRCVSDAPPKPGRLTTANTRQIAMSQFGYTFTLPPVGAPDVASRTLRVSVDNLDPVIVSMPGQPTVSDEVVLDLGNQVSITLTDTDAAGNASVPSDPLQFVVTDTVPPPQPGGLNVASVRQID